MYNYAFQSIIMLFKCLTMFFTVFAVSGNMNIKFENMILTAFILIK